MVMRSLGLLILSAAVLLTACSSNETAGNQATPLPPRGAQTQVPTPAPTVEPPNITEVPRPQKIVDLMASRGEQDSASPTLKIIEPKANAVIENTSTVKVSLELGGDLKGYQTGMDEATHTGNHIHVIFDNQPYEAYYNLGQPFELRN